MVGILSLVESVSILRLSNMAPNSPEIKCIEYSVFIKNSERYGIVYNKRICIVRSYGTMGSIILCIHMLFQPISVAIFKKISTTVQ